MAKRECPDFSKGFKPGAAGSEMCGACEREIARVQKNVASMKQIIRSAKKGGTATDKQIRGKRLRLTEHLIALRSQRRMCRQVCHIGQRQPGQRGKKR